MGSFCVYADILGFENLAKEIKNTARFKSIDYVRNSIILDPVLERISSEIVSNDIRYIGSLKNPSSDDFKFTTSQFFKVKEILSKLASIQIPFEGYDTIPFIFAIDYQEDPVDDVKDIATQSWINFLKSHIVGKYKQIKEKLINDKIKKTFVIITKNAYDNLDYLGRIKFRLFRLNLYEFVYESDENYIRELEQRNKFLQIIGYSRDKQLNTQIDLYKKIIEYDEIKNKLASHHIVFLTGPSGYGKTLTAISLLNDYYKDDFNPVMSSKRISIDKLKASIVKASNTIYLLDDIFQRIEHENLGKLLDIIEFPGENYIIVTLPLNYPDKYRELGEVRLNFIKNHCFEISTRSYSPEIRTTILDDSAQFYQCKWLNDSRLKDTITNLVTMDGYLESPYSINTFCFSTRNELNLINIKSLIERLSQSLEDYFAILIKDSSREKIGLYFLVYCLSNPQVETISRLMRQMTKSEFLFNTTDYLLSFVEDTIKFAHPLISQGFKLFLKKFFNTRKNKALIKRILSTVSNDDHIRFYDKFSCFYEIGNLMLDEGIIKISYDLLDRFKSELSQTFCNNSSPIDIFRYLEVRNDINLSIHSVIVSEKYFEIYSEFLVLVMKIEYKVGKRAREIIASYPKNLIEIYGPEARGPITPELVAADAITFKDSTIIESVFSKVYYLNEKGYGEIYDKMTNDPSCIEVVMGRILVDLSTWSESKTIETSSRIPRHVIIKSFLIQIPKNPIYLLTVHTYREYFTEEEISLFVSVGFKSHPNDRALFEEVFNA